MPCIEKARKVVWAVAVHGKQSSQPWKLMHQVRKNLECVGPQNVGVYDFSVLTILELFLLFLSRVRLAFISLPPSVGRNGFSQA